MKKKNRKDLRAATVLPLGSTPLMSMSSGHLTPGHEIPLGNTGLMIRELKEKTVEPLDSSKPYRYEEARELLKSIIGDFLILSGDEIGPSDVTWQDVAGTASCNLYVLACRLEAARKGFAVASEPIVFPSPADLDDWGTEDRDKHGYDPIGGGGGTGRSDLPHGQGGGDD
jgi:hypothetical protein